MHQHRLVICNITPSLQNGAYPIKRTIGQQVIVRADIFGDGHKRIHANLLWKEKQDPIWNRIPMNFISNDCWEAAFSPNGKGIFEYTIEAWYDFPGTWKEELIRKIEAHTFTKSDLEPGIEVLSKIPDKSIQRSIQEIQSAQSPELLLSLIRTLIIPRSPEHYHPQPTLFTYPKIYEVTVKRDLTNTSSWYEIFPRSCSENQGKHGTFKDVIKLIPSIADLGFNILYFPPIHPIGLTNRKGKNNSRQTEPGDPGSPWAIGSEEGGHKSIHPSLGNLDDFKAVLKTAKEFGLEVAMDIAFQCSPDHPYLKQHPEWFKWRSDGTIQYAENPPKKYEDIVPFNFESGHEEELWQELKSIFVYWMNVGVKIFRVDNPHTKPFDMWEWLISEINKIDPDVILLAEAFTRPKVMHQLSLIGFDQSYTYFTWRNTKQELLEYMDELHRNSLPDHFRPCFWPNTPDILSEYLKYGGKPAFIARLVLAATLSSNYGIYGPLYEFCIHEAVTDSEEYLNSEKYELKSLKDYQGDNIRPLIKRVNAIRKSFSALKTTYNVYFCETQNDQLIAYVKFSQTNDPHLLIVVNIDYSSTQEGIVSIPIELLGVEQENPYAVYDLLDNEKYFWSGRRNYVKLGPQHRQAHIFLIIPHLNEENQFTRYINTE